MVSFSYSSYDFVALGKAACIGLALRNDYDSLTETYSNSSIYPSLDVQVCTWWTPGLTRNGSLGNVTIGADLYELCLQNSNNPGNTTSWPSYLFVSNSNLLSVTNLDLWMFLSYVGTITNLTNYYVTGGYFGFRIYWGYGNFILTSDPQFLRSAIPSNQTPTSTNQTNQSNQKFLIPSYAREYNFTYDILLGILSTPSAIILLQLSPLVIVLDDYSYYAYHSAGYDRGFKLIVEFTWELNNKRWIPPFLKDAYQKVNDALHCI